MQRQRRGESQQPPLLPGLQVRLDTPQTARQVDRADDRPLQTDSRGKPAIDEDDGPQCRSPPSQADTLQEQPGEQERRDVVH